MFQLRGFLLFSFLLMSVLAADAHRRSITVPEIGFSLSMIKACDPEGHVSMPSKNCRLIEDFRVNATAKGSKDKVSPPSTHYGHTKDITIGPSCSIRKYQSFHFISDLEIKLRKILV